MSTSSNSAFTARLQAWRNGDETAREEVFLFIYQELRRLAQSYLNHERSDHTLQATALVNEAYLRLCGDGPLEWNDRQHFFRAAAQTMRRILLDYARARNASKRPDPRMRVALSDAWEEASLPREIDLLALNEALAQLGEISPRTVEIIELRYFCGLTEAETAQLLSVSPATIKREWNFARKWIQRYLSGLTAEEPAKSAKSHETKNSKHKDIHEVKVEQSLE